MFGSKDPHRNVGVFYCSDVCSGAAQLQLGNLFGTRQTILPWEDQVPPEEKK